MPGAYQSQANIMQEPLHYYNNYYFGVPTGSNNNFVHQRDLKHYGLTNHLNQGQH